MCVYFRRFCEFLDFYLYVFGWFFEFLEGFCEAYDDVGDGFLHEVV